MVLILFLLSQYSSYESSTFLLFACAFTNCKGEFVESEELTSLSDGFQTDTPKIRSITFSNATIVQVKKRLLYIFWTLTLKPVLDD
jgi:hypothetical protein